MKAISCPRWHIHIQYGKTSTAISIWNETKFSLTISAPTLHVSEKQYIFAIGFWFITVWDSWLSWRRSFLLPFHLTRMTTVVMSMCSAKSNAIKNRLPRFRLSQTARNVLRLRNQPFRPKKTKCWLMPSTGIGNTSTNRLRLHSAVKKQNRLILKTKKIGGYWHV